MPLEREGGSLTLEIELARPIRMLIEPLGCLPKDVMGLDAEPRDFPDPPGVTASVACLAVFRLTRPAQHELIAASFPLLGVRHATLRELLAYVAALRQDIGTEMLSALGSVHLDRSEFVPGWETPCAPYVSEADGKLWLGLSPCHGRWNAGSRFLAALPLP